MKLFFEKIKKPREKLLITALIALYVMIIYFSPMSCPILTITKIPCPGCGMTRAWISVLKLDFSAAFSYNAMFWSVPLLYYALLTDGTPFKNKKFNICFYAIIIGGFATNWLFNIIQM